MAEFRNRLKELRDEKNITQRDLAKLISVAPSTVAMWEKGDREPNHDTLRTLSKFFNCTADYLLGLSPRNKQETDTADNLFKAQLAANMEAEYGKPPSPEMLSLAEKVYKKVLKEISEETKNVDK